MQSMLYIDHGNTAGEFPIFEGKIYRVNYAGSYLETLRQWVNNNYGMLDSGNPHVWITSSVCDYRNFDFRWKVNKYQVDQLHVFSSGHKNIIQKFGDTFFVDMLKFKDNVAGLSRLEDYPAYINYIENIVVPRHPHPVVHHQHDSQISAVPNVLEYNFPYTELIDSNNFVSGYPILPNLWYSDNMQIIVGAAGGTHLYVPKIAAMALKNKKEIYDWPIIYFTPSLGRSKPLDIIFISNGEPSSEDNWKHLNTVVQASGGKNRLVWVKDVQGRVASQHAAAAASNTNWYFLVNAKLSADPAFNWNWQPDRLQEPKHYIFIAINPINGLKYGHQAIVANNKLLTLNTRATGLDFTMDSPHAVVDIVCGTTNYDTDRWTVWRTAFRESIKLINSGDVESIRRLESWLTIGQGKHGDWSTAGARDGVKFWNSCHGRPELLMQSYDWVWLNNYFASMYAL